MDLTMPSPFGGLKFDHAMWIHGVSGQLDWVPSLPDTDWRARIDMLSDRSFIVNRIGTGIRIEMTGSLSGNYVVHFPIPTQNMIIDSPHLLLQSVMLDFNASVAVVGKVEVRDGNETIASFKGLNMSGNRSLEVIEVTELPPIFKGINVSVTIEEAIGGIGVIVFRAVGINMVRKTGTLPQTLGS